MSLSDRLAKLNLLQRSRRFKIIASAVVVVLAVAGFSVWWTILNAPDAQTQPGVTADAPAAQPAPIEDDPEGDGPRLTTQTDETLDDPDIVVQRETGDFQPRVDPDAVLRVLGSRDATLGVAIGVAVATGVALLIIWLGVGLTYLAILLATLLLVVPLRLIPATEGFAALLAGVAALAASFTVFIETARALLASSHPVFAIARTVVSEAVRMKISLVFIILLIGWLAALPFLLNETQPLRFRVQTFLQNGVTGAFWALALLTVFFAVATVAFEQRDKIVWSTVVKPVKAWHYVIGKWLGVMAVNAAMLAVAGSGVFLFTEYLRAQPARGEIAPYVAADGSDMPTQDRLILEARVLTARAAVSPVLPPVPPEAIEAEIQRRVDETLGAERATTPEAQVRDLARAVRPAAITRLEAARTAIAPFDAKEYRFVNLDEARELGRPVTLRYTIQAGANDPTTLMAVLFEFIDTRTGEIVPLSVDAPLDIAQSVDLRPAIIDENGEILVRVYNGDPTRRMANDITMRFPPDGLEILYTKGGYEINFLRVCVSLLIKLGLIAAAGVFAATFLSFPVAALFAFIMLFAAETSGFLAGALDIYSLDNLQGEFSLFRAVIRAIATPVAAAFVGYRDLNAIDRLVDGKLLSWSQFLGSGAIIILITAAVLAAASVVFKKRELATYSGH